VVTHSLLDRGKFETKYCINVLLFDYSTCCVTRSTFAITEVNWINQFLFDFYSAVHQKFHTTKILVASGMYVKHCWVFRAQRVHLHSSFVISMKVLSMP
jgi:hypothetical protein